ncbi:MAG: DUF2283 domain-containing protein [Candidatus Taylorbacteria bacterium]|nr:DUF2283 domain-containing protein [Candidatus Taylorbacteria bacterium]
MKFNYDTVADAAYLHVNEGKIAKTVEIKDGVNVDVGKKGTIIGIEILNFSFQQNIQKLRNSVKEGLPIQITSGTPVIA